MIQAGLPVTPPDPPRASFCLTFDNLGEAAELGEGAWPADAPVGRHYSVDVIPSVLELLDRHGLAATFFLEGFNAEVYPAVLETIAERGHELAAHGWQHERWSDLSPEREREILVRSTAALGSLGSRPVGLRPPGGLITPRTLGLLAELGYTYCSPVGSRAGVADGIAVIPFEWQLVDALYYVPSFASLREARGLPAEPLSADALLAAMRTAIGGAATAVPIFHPMLLTGPEALGALDRLLGEVRELEDRGEIDCLRMRDLADRLLAQPQLAGAPLLDEAARP